MCLAVPMKVLQVHGNTAQVDIHGAERRVRLDIIDRQPEVGDYVIVHAGFAIRLIDEQEAEIALGYFRAMTCNDNY